MTYDRKQLIAFLVAWSLILTWIAADTYSEYR